MKKFILALIFVAGVPALASTKDIKQFVFVGDKVEDSFVLNAQKTHTEYRTDVITTTCYREEFAGYHQVCRTDYRTECHQERRCRIVHNVRECWYENVCRQYPYTHCYQEPYYYTVPYTCQKTVQVPFEVKDFDVQAKVRVNYGALPEGLKLSETFSLELVGDQLVLKTLKEKSNALIFVDKQVSEFLAGGLKTIEATYTLEFVALDAIAKPLTTKPSGFAVSNNENFSFVTGAIKNPEFFTMHFVMKKAKFLASDDTVVNVELPVESLGGVVTGATTRFNMTLTSLGFPANRKDGKYTVDVTLKAIVDQSKLLNPKNLPKNLAVKGEGKFKLK